MRPIDADAIKLEKGFFENIDNVPKFFEWLGKQPAIDAVEVVRCKDCEFYTEEERWCRRLGLYGAFDPNGYCSKGERKNETD